MLAAVGGGARRPEARAGRPSRARRRPASKGAPGPGRPSQRLSAPRLRSRSRARRRERNRSHFLRAAVCGLLAARPQRAPPVPRLAAAPASMHLSGLPPGRPFVPGHQASLSSVLPDALPRPVRGTPLPPPGAHSSPFPDALERPPGSAQPLKRALTGQRLLRASPWGLV